MNKFTTFASAAVMVGFSSITFGMGLDGGVPPAPPSIYDNGPASPAVFSTNITAAERAAFGLLELAMQVTEAKIHATSCNSTVGSYSLNLFANGLLKDDPLEDNTLQVGPAVGGYLLEAKVQEPVNFRGQKVKMWWVKDPFIPSLFDGSEVQEIHGTATYNEVNNMLYQFGRMQVRGANGRFDKYQGRVIKDFYQGIFTASRYEILDWGLQALFKFGYPTHKYWQRSKVKRSNGQEAYTWYVKDRLVGPTSCRITIHVKGFNEEDFILQDGFLEVSRDLPSDDPMD